MTRLTWLGHSTVLIESGGRRLLTDPVLGGRIGPVLRRAQAPEGVGSVDGILISHFHHDHLDLPSLRRLSREAQIVMPARGGRVVRKLGFAEVVELDHDGVTTVGDVTIRAVPARHSGRRMPFGPVGPALGFVIEAEHRIYFAGDTDIFDDMAAFADGLDLAILSVGGWGPTLRGGHMDAKKAAQALTLLRPRVAVAVHWGTLWPMGLARVRRHRFEEPAREFRHAAEHVAPDVEIVMVEPGGAFELEPGTTER